MGMKLSDYVAKQPTSSVGVNNTAGTTPTQSFVSGSSLLGGAPTLSPAPKRAAETPKVENKNTGLEIVGRGLAALPGSIAKGTTSAIDKITDTPSYVGKLFADSTKGKVTGGYYESAKANAAYEKARDTHVLGQGVQNWQNKVDARRDQIVLDNPNSKVAEYTGKALQLGEAAGEMLPTVAAAALTGGIGTALAGGSGAVAAAEAAQSLGVASKAAKALSTASKIGEAAGLGVMAMDVYAKSVDESTKQGYDFVQSSKKAFGDAVLEVGTEMMFGGIAFLGEGAVSAAAKNIQKRSLAAAAASEGAEKAVKMLGVEKAVLATAGLVNRVSAFAASTPGRRLVTSMLGEGAEEMVSEFFGPYIERMTTNPNADNATLGQMIEAGVGGALLSFFMSPLGKLQDSIGRPDADVVEKARTILKLQDADMNLTLARNLAFDSIADEDVPVIEQLLGRTVEPGTNFIRGLAARDYEAVYQDRLSKALTEAEQSGKTPEAMSRMWREFADVFDQVSIDRADEVAAEIHNSTTVAQAAENSKAVLSAREAVNAAKEKLAKAQEAADKALTDKKNKSTGYAKAVADAKQELSRAQAALQEAEAGAKRSVELRLSRSDAVERFGKEAVDNFSAAQRVREIKAGRFYAADENGAERIYTREQYAAEKFGGKRYSQLTAKQKAVVDKAQADYQEKIKAELDAWSTKINEAIKARGLGDKLRVEISDGHKFAVGYNKGVIHFSTSRVHTTQAADYYLAHEFTHAVEDRLFTTAEQKADFRKVLNGAMQTVGFDHDRWYARLEARYKNDYAPAIRAEAKRKGVKDVDGYVEKELYERIESEVYARFMQTAFGSESILQSLAVFSPDLVEQMRNSIGGSSVAELTDSLWDYERMRILERIDRAIAAPTDAETNKEKNAEAVEQAFKAVGDMGFVEVVDDVWDSGNFYSKMEQVIEDTKQNKLGGASVISYLRGKGVKEEEIKWSGLEDFLDGKKSVTKDELLAYVKASRYPIFVRKLSGRDTRWGGYITYDGPVDTVNYREYLYTSGATDYANSALQTHWGNSSSHRDDYGKGVLAHARVVDTGHPVDGTLVLFVEEIQSDLHNEKESADTRRKMGARDLETFEDDFTRGFITEEELSRARDKVARLEKRLSSIPDAPFSNGEYVNFVLKNLLQEAAANGYDYLGWTSGKQQEERWSDQFAEGYRIEYDQDIPKFMNKFGKKFGAKAELYMPEKSQLADPEHTFTLSDFDNFEIRPFYGFDNEDVTTVRGIDFEDTINRALWDISRAHDVSGLGNIIGLHLGKRMDFNGTTFIELLNESEEKIGDVSFDDTSFVGNEMWVDVFLIDNKREGNFVELHGRAKNENSGAFSGSWFFPITDEMRKSVLEVGQPMYFKDIDEASGNLYNVDENNVGGNEDDRNRRYYVTGNRRGDEGGLSEGTREQERLGTVSSEGLFSEDYENRRSSLLERARGLRTLRDGAETETVTYRHDYGPRVYQYVKNRNDLPGAVRDTLADMDELSRFSASIGAPELQSFFVLDDVLLEAVDGESVEAGGFYSPSYNIIVFPFQNYGGVYSIDDSVGIRHEQTHAVQYLIPDCCDLFTDELYSSSGLSSRELHDLLTDYYKYHLRYYGDDIDSAEELQNELFSDILAGKLYQLPKRYWEQLIGFRERFAPVLTQFVNERGLNIDFTDWLKPTKTDLEYLEIDVEGRRLDKSLFRGAVAEWASDNGFDIDDLDFFPNGLELYVVPKQASEILSVDDIMGIPSSEYVAILSAGKDKVGPYLEEKSSGERATLIYPDEMFFRSVDSDAEFSEEGRRRYEEFRKLDEEYAKAVSSNDEKTLSSLVERAARAAGYNSPVLYHGTTAFGFNKFNTDKSGGMIFAASEKELAESYYPADGNETNGTYSLYAKLGRSLDVDGYDYSYNDLPLPEELEPYWPDDHPSDKFSTREIADIAKRAGYDSVVFLSLRDSGGTPRFKYQYGFSYPVDQADVYVLFNPSQVKSAENIIRDDNGNIISLSERFNSETDDLRFFRSVDSDAEFSEEQLRQYEELKRKYGKDDFGTPNKINDHSATSRFASRLIGNKANIWDVDENGQKTMTGVRTPEELQEAMKRELLNGVYTHIVHTDEAAMTAAKGRMLYHEEYTKKGNDKKTVQHKTLADSYSYARGMLESGRALNKNDIAFAQQLIVDMTDRYNQIEAGKNPVEGESTDTTELFNQLQEMIALTCAAGTRAGQNLQAFSLLKKMTPQGRLFYIEQQSNQLLTELVDRRGESRVSGYRYQKDDLGRYKTDASGHPIPITISSELRTKMLNCTAREEIDAVEKEIISDIASQIGPTITDRVVAWRYLAMLGNPRTHVRNLVSNAAMGVSVQLKNAIGGVLEDQILSGKTTGRTKTAKQVDPATRKALLDFADNDWTQDNMNEIALSGGKVGFQNRINEERRKLGTEKFHLLDTASKKNTELLEKADDVAAKYAYKRAFAGYAAANGLSVEYLGAGTVESNTALAQARSYAIKEAAKATYHDASDVATMLNELEKKSGLAGKIVVGGLVPFKKTPVNILKRGVEYSPLGLLSGIKKTVMALNTVTEDIYEVDGKKVTKSVYESEYGGQGGRFVKPADYESAYTATTSEDALDMANDPETNQSRAYARFNAEAQKTKAVADAIDRMAAGLTGTGLMILGLLLAKLGMMSGAGSDNDDEKYYDEMTGTQEYSITIGNTNYTLDWLTPVSMPMFAGVALWEMFSPDEEVDFPDLLTAVSKLADPVMNLSVLQGVNDAISSYDSGLGKVVLSSAESFAGQFIPTLSGQLARSVDPTRRTTYAPKDSDNLLGKEGATFLNRMKNKIPGLSQKNAAYVDQWGRTEEDDSGFIGRLFANSVNPSYTRQTNKTQADDYISMLLTQTGDRTVIPKSPDANYVFGDDKFYLTSDEYQTTKQLVGQISNVGVTSLLSVPGFAQLSADEQADLVSDIYSFARKVAKADYAVANGLSYTEESSVVRIKNAVAAGMSIGAAMYVNYVANSMTADKDANGKSISGSKKAKVLNLYTMMGLTPQQIEAISIYDTN